MQPNLAYQERKRADCNFGHTNCDPNPNPARNMYTPQDARASRDFNHHRAAASVPFNPATSRNPFVNGSSLYVYQSRNSLCYKGGIPGHTASQR